MLKKVYFLSGLGADYRAFRSLDLSFCEPVFLSWLVPRPQERIDAYAKRFALQFTEPNPLFVGLSFGGILAMELAKHMVFEKIIIISSAKTFKEIPPYFRAMKWLPVHRLIPPQLVKRANAFAYKLMGIHRRSDKILFMQMFNESDNRYVSWAINQVIIWRNLKIPANTVHIHGREDILLPHRFVKADYSVPNGEHLMPMIQPELVSRLLKDLMS